MTEEELEEFKKAVAEAAKGGIVLTILEIILCFTMKKGLNAMWILITAL